MNAMYELQCNVQEQSLDKELECQVSRKAKTVRGSRRGRLQYSNEISVGQWLLAWLVLPSSTSGSEVSMSQRY